MSYVSNKLTLDFKNNSFNVLRLALALSVMVAHSWELGEFGYDPVYRFSGEIYSIGALAVDGFFCISGMLIVASYKNINSMVTFLWHRFLRIFPGYWLCILLTAILVPRFLGESSNLKYAILNTLTPATSIFQAIIGLLSPIVVGWGVNPANLADKIPLFGQASIPGVLDGQAVNGSLWSLGQEVRLYFLVALLGMFGLLKKPILIFLLLLSWAAYAYSILRNPSWDGLANASPFRTTAHFLAGSIFYLWMPILRHHWAALALITSVVALGLGCYATVSPVTSTYLIAYLATVIPLYNFGKTRDLSYGIYIYAFPIQKTLTALSLNRFGLPFYFFLSLVFTMCCAIISWYGIEKVALKLKRWKVPLGIRKLIWLDKAA